MFSSRDGLIMGAEEEGKESSTYQRSGADKYCVELQFN